MPGTAPPNCNTESHKFTPVAAEAQDGAEVEDHDEKREGSQVIWRLGEVGLAHPSVSRSPPGARTVASTR